MVGNNLPNFTLIVPMLRVGIQPEPLRGLGRWSVPPPGTHAEHGYHKRKLFLPKPLVKHLGNAIDGLFD